MKQEQIEHQTLLHELAIECLRLKKVCLSRDEQWGADFWGDIYSSLIRDISKGNEDKQPALTEDQRNAIIDEIFAPDTTSYTLLSDMQVGPDGLSFTPETK